MATLRFPLRRCSQASIARELRLSQPAVSLALNGKRDQLRPETYARIWAHALAAGYRGKGIALETSPGRSGGLAAAGILYAAPELRLDPFFAAVQWATEELLAEQGIPVVPLGAGGRLRERVAGALTSGPTSTAGVIIFGAVPLPVVARLAAQGRRIVTVGWTGPRTTAAVLSPDAEAISLLLRRLQRAGHTDVVWFGRELPNAASAARAGREGLRLHGEPRFTTRAPTRAAGREVARAFLAADFPAGARPTAVLCSDRSVAQGAIEEFRLRGLSASDRPSVVALGGPDAAADDDGGVTTAGAEPAQMAAGIVELLLSETPAAGERQRILVPPARLFSGDREGAKVAPASPRRLPAPAPRPMRAA